MKIMMTPQNILIVNENSINSFDGNDIYLLFLVQHRWVALLISKSISFSVILPYFHFFVKFH